jgi:hypothetical protein
MTHTTTPQFNPIHYTKKMIAIGFTQQQAEGQAEALIEIIDNNLATKTDVFLIQRDIKQIESNLKRDIEASRLDSKNDIALIQKDIANIESSLKKDIANIESSLKKDIANIESSLKKDIEASRLASKNDIASSELKILNKIEKITNTNLYWIITFIGLSTAILGLIQSHH